MQNTKDYFSSGNIFNSPLSDSFRRWTHWLISRTAVSDYGDSRDIIHDMQYFCEFSSDEARKALLKAILKTCYWEQFSTVIAVLNTLLAIFAELCPISDLFSCKPFGSLNLNLKQGQLLRLALNKTEFYKMICYIVAGLSAVLKWSQ